MNSTMHIAKIKHGTLLSSQYAHLQGRYLKVVEIQKSKHTEKTRVSVKVWSRLWNRYITMDFALNEVVLCKMYPNAESLFMATRTGGKVSRKKLLHQIV